MISNEDAKTLGALYNQASVSLTVKWFKPFFAQQIDVTGLDPNTVMTILGLASVIDGLVHIMTVSGKSHTETRDFIHDVVARLLQAVPAASREVLECGMRLAVANPPTLPATSPQPSVGLPPPLPELETTADAHGEPADPHATALRVSDVLSLLDFTDSALDAGEMETDERLEHRRLRTYATARLEHVIFDTHAKMHSLTEFSCGEIHEVMTLVLAAWAALLHGAAASPKSEDSDYYQIAAEDLDEIRHILIL